MNLNDDSLPALSLNERLKALNISYCTLLCLLACIDVLGPLATDAHLPSLPTMTVDLHTSPSWIQFSVLAYSFVMAIASLCGGYWSDKYGRRILTIAGLVCFTIGGFGSSYAPNIWMLNASRLLQGFGGGVSSTITSSVARDVFMANERMKILGVLGSLRPFAIAAAPIFGGWLAETYDWRMVFLVTSCAAVVVLLGALLWLPETKQKFFSQTGSASQLSSQMDLNASVCRIALSDHILLVVSCMLAFRMVAVFVFLNEFPFVVEHVYGYSEFTSGALIGCGALFLVAGAAVSIMLSKLHKVSIMRLAALCSLVACIVLVGAPLIKNWTQFDEHEISLRHMYTYNDWYYIVIPFCMLTFSQGLNGPPSMVIVLEPYPHMAGTIGSLLTFWRLILPSVVMIVITQVASDKTDELASLIIYATMASMAFLCFALMFGGTCLSKQKVQLRMQGHEIMSEERDQTKLLSSALLDDDDTEIAVPSVLSRTRTSLSGD